MQGDNHDFKGNQYKKKQNFQYAPKTKAAGTKVPEPSATESSSAAQTSYQPKKGQPHSAYLPK